MTNIRRAEWTAANDCYRHPNLLLPGGKGQQLDLRVLPCSQSILSLAVHMVCATNRFLFGTLRFHADRCKVCPQYLMDEPIPTTNSNQENPFNRIVQE